MKIKKPKVLQKGDKIAIVSLSSGILGEESCNHQVELGIKRLNQFGLKVEFMPNSLKGLDYIKHNPKARANDLKDAYMDDTIRAIICAIGGDDTYKILPYLIEDSEFIKKVRCNPKIFIGFSDSTNNHFMFHKLGVVSYYGMSFLNDFAELDKNMLTYTENSFKGLFTNTEKRKILSSGIWYEERTNFSITQLNKPRKSHKEQYGYEVLRGRGTVCGELLGGCLESIYNMITGDRYYEQKLIYDKYEIIPSIEEWKDKILFLETSEQKVSPEKFTKMIDVLLNKGIIPSVKAIIMGKPQDEVYYNEYKEILIYKTEYLKTPILYNLNFGHAYPHMIIPYGIKAEIDFDNIGFTIIEKMFS